MLCNPVVWERKSTRGHCILPKLHRSNVCNRRHKTSLTTVHCIQRPSKRHLGLFCAPVSVNTRKSMTKPWGFTYGRAQKFTDFQGVHNTCGASVLFYSTQHFTCRSNRVQITAGEQNIQGAKRHYYQGCLEQLMHACMLRRVRTLSFKLESIDCRDKVLLVHQIFLNLDVDHT